MLALCAVVLLLWPATAVPEGVTGVTPPWWGGFLDLLLEGPDAGEWAVNAARVADGQLRQVDHHRMPSWLLLTGGLHRAGVDLLTAGHLVNRGLYVLLGLATWAAGRLALGPGTALLAATLTLGAPHLRLAAERFGIDVAVGAAVAVVAAAGLAAGRWPRAAPLLGLLVCGAALTHFTTLPLVLPALLLALAAGAPGRRLQAAGGLALGVAAAGLVAAWLLRLPSPGELATAIYNGLPSSAQAGRPQDVAALVLELALPELARGLLEGPADLLHAVRPAGSPWPIVLLLGWLGLLGPRAIELLRPPPGGRGAAWRGLLLGLALASLATAVPLLSAVQAPERYTSNLGAVGALIIARGVAALALSLGRLLPRALLPRALPPQPIEWLVPAALALLALPRLHQPSPVPGDSAIGMLLLTEAIEQAVPAHVPVAAAAREVAVASAHPWCSWPLCDQEAPASDPAACMARVRQTCGSGAALAWVSLPGWRLWGAQNDELRALDAWLATQGPALRTISYGDFSAELRLLPPLDP